MAYFGKLGKDVVEQAHQAFMLSKLSFADDGQKERSTALWSDRFPYIAKDQIGRVEGVSGLHRGLSMLLDPGW